MGLLSLVFLVTSSISFAELFFKYNYRSEERCSFFFFPTRNLMSISFLNENRAQVTYSSAVFPTSRGFVQLKVEWMVGKRESTKYSNCSQWNSPAISANSTPVSLKSADPQIHCSHCLRRSKNLPLCPFTTLLRLKTRGIIAVLLVIFLGVTLPRVIGTQWSTQWSVLGLNVEKKL